MPSPLRGTEIGFLDDLFVGQGRGSGVAEALLRKLTGLPASVAGVSSDGLRGMEITGPAVFTTAWRKDLTGSPMR